MQMIYNTETKQRLNEERIIASKDIFEGQIMMTEKNVHTFDRFLTIGKDLKRAIIKQYKKRV